MILRSWKLPWVSRPGIEKIPGMGAGRPCVQVLQKSPEYGRPTVLAAKIIGAALLVSLFALELKTS